MTAPAVSPPPRAERWLRAALAATPYRDDILGDLHEAHARLAARRSQRFAGWWYRVQALRLATRFGIRCRPAFKRRGTHMDRLVMDIRLAARSLAKRPMMTLTVIATLGVAIGANVSVFGVVDAMLLHPFTIGDVDRIVMPVTTSPRWTDKRETVSAADFLDWRRDLRGGAIEHVAAINWWDANLVGRDEPERLLGFFVSPDFFTALGGSPALGRTFLPEEEVPSNARRVVLSDGLWKRRFGGDRDIVGRPVLVDGQQWIVVGVMPPSFVFPMRAELWAPLAFDEKTARDRSAHGFTVFGRLAANRSIDDARAQMRTIAARLSRDYPKTNAELGADVYTLSRGMADVGVPQVLALWQAAGVFVILIACANIANLLLARAAEREREIAIRLALGASRRRIVRESLIESALLAAASVPLAMAIASVSLRAMQAAMPARIVRYIAGWDRLGLHTWTVVAAIVFAAVVALVFGVLPAVQMARGIVTDALKSDGRTGAGPGRQRIRRGLVVAEIALVLPLLVAAMMSVSTVVRFLTGWQGYDPNNVLTMRAVLPESRYPDADTRERFTTAALDRLAAVPGARAVAVGNVVPALDSNARRAIEIDGRPNVDPEKAPRVDYRVVSPRYFDVLRLPVGIGRAFTDTDQKAGEPVAIVSESMARKFWPDGRALDGRVRIGTGPWLRVVGVCGDVVHDWFDGQMPTLYQPIAQAPTDSLVFAIRTATEPSAVAADAKAAIAQVDAMQPLFDVMSERQVLTERTISLKYIATVMGVFAGIALLLALVGLYAVMTFLVARRAREIGVRIALGATKRDVMRLALLQAARLTGIGIAIGLLLAIALSRAMEAGLLGIVPSDIRLTAALAVALGITTLAAGYLPARRAASVDPIVALRNE